jgi:cell division protein FtsI/penicillin-binding protein 2
MTDGTRQPPHLESAEPEQTVEEHSGAGEQSNEAPLSQVTTRVRLPIAIFLIAFLIVIIRLVHWQILGGAQEVPMLSAQAEEISRGRILDSDGLLLATDDFSWEVYVNPQKMQTAAIGSTLVISLTEILGMPAEKLQAELESDVTATILTRKGTDTQRRAIAALKQPGLVWCVAKRIRAYPQGALAAHVFGFTNYLQEGLYGVEASYDGWLRSTAEWPADRLPGEPQPLPDAWKAYLPSPAGHDLILYLNAPLQYIVEKRLVDALAYYGAEEGTVILMDPRTSGILAMANTPTFDPNRYSEFDQETWVNTATSRIFEPGSVFKLVTYAAALDTGLITPESPFNDEGELMISGRMIRNAQLKTYGRVTARQALAKSINVVAARIALDMGDESFYRYVRLFGFGRLTEVDLNLESPGIVKDRSNSAWSGFDLGANSFGQGISVTGLQMINAVAAIANKGILLQPQAGKALVFNGQAYNLPSRVLGYPIKPETAQTLTRMMVYNVDSSAYANLVPGYRLAGKTGTAEIPTEKGYTSQRTITSFVGFLPAADPQLVILIKLVKPTKSPWAEQVAVPVFGQVAQDAVRILNIKPNTQQP